MLSPLEQSSRDAALETPEDVQAILGLTAAGWGRRRIARELGCSPETVRKYRRQGGSKEGHPYSRLQQVFEPITAWQSIDAEIA